MTIADLSVIPDAVARWKADQDFQIAKACREEASRQARFKGPAWRFVHRLELRRAIRYWQSYAAAIRSATQ